MKKNYDNISLLIIGYDPYIDVWNHYFELLNKYWPDRPKTFLATNTATPNYKGVKVIPCGADAEWSKKVYISIDHIKTDYIVLLLEDFFTTQSVDGIRFANLVTFLENENIDYCKLLNQSKIKGKPYKGRNYLHILSEKSEYGVSLQPAIWKKTFLRNLLGTDNYNAWFFELKQVKNRTHLRPDIICLGDNRNILEITHAVVQGKYLRQAVKTFRRQGYYLDISKRPVMSISESIKYNLKCIISDIAPKALKPFLKKIGQKIKVDFVSDRQLKE